MNEANSLFTDLAALYKRSAKSGNKVCCGIWIVMEGFAFGGLWRGTGLMIRDQTCLYFVFLR